MAINDIPFDKFGKQSRLVFFTGAGISAESGIATFRDPDGHWSKYDPMKLASPEGFREDPELVLKWYEARRQNINNAQPNAAHKAITEFQKLFPQSVVITQNVDGLHARAGNKSILELHGNIFAEKCFLCGAHHSGEESDGEPLRYCACGGMLRPDVVWFGESLPITTLNEAFDMSRECEILFTIGTSTQIYPASQLPFEAHKSGVFVIEINPEPTPFSRLADLRFSEPAGEILPKLYKEFYEALN